MLRFGRRDNPHALAVGMTGVKMGDRLLQIDAPSGQRLGALASKVGLSGRAVAIVPDEAAAARARKGAADAGALVEVEVASPQALSVEEGAFDLAVIDDTGGFLGSLSSGDRDAVIRAVQRALRPGGRLMVISEGPRSGLGAMFAKPAAPPFDATPLLQADGFRSVRKLAEREGLSFVEGLKPRT